ncbi:MAG: hypothetical protein HYS15_02995 [Candidatus Spechtbacteria bacterium]|nr:hypothetical protein [Candidatus Spechtbacteria bacterium]
MPSSFLAANSKDVPTGRERAVYRFFEILPGFLILTTFGLAALFSWLKPLWIAVFILAFDVYWIFKVVYFSIHTRAAYRRMKENLSRDWMAELAKLPLRQLTTSPLPDRQAGPPPLLNKERGVRSVGVSYKDLCAYD